MSFFAWTVISPAASTSESPICASTCGPDPPWFETMTSTAPVAATDPDARGARDREHEPVLDSSPPPPSRLPPARTDALSPIQARTSEFEISTTTVMPTLADDSAESERAADVVDRDRVRSPRR